MSMSTSSNRNNNDNNNSSIRASTSTTATARTAYTSFSTRSGSRRSPQKKLTPPPQLHERSLLSGQQYRQSHLQLQGQNRGQGQEFDHGQSQGEEAQVQVRRHQSYSQLQGRSRYQPQLQLHLNQQRQNPRQQQQTTTTTQHLRLHLRGGPAPDQEPGLGQGVTRPGEGGSAAARPFVRGRDNTFPVSSNGRHLQHARDRQRENLHHRGDLSINISNPDASFSPSPTVTTASTTSLSSTSTLHPQTYWPDNFRDPRGGLGIEHNPPSPTPPSKSHLRRVLHQQTDSDDESGVNNKTVTVDNNDSELLPPPSFARNEQDGSGNRDTSDNWRPASSIYSLSRESYASPVSPNFANVASRNTYTAAVADVSPPSSPDVETRRNGNPTHDRNVSPIDVSPNMSQLSIGDHPGQTPGSTPPPQQKSSIPMMRRERRKNQNQAQAQAHAHAQNEHPDQDHGAPTLRETKSQQRLRIQRETKWDDMTGEPTSLDTGRSGSVRPQEYAQEFGSSKQLFGRSAAALKAMHNAPQAQETFTDRLRRLRPLGAGKQQPEVSPTAPEAIEERPPWRGASGRTPIVNPVKDTAPKEPLTVPKRNSRRMAVGPRLPIAGVNSPMSPVSTSESETSPRAKAPAVRTVLHAPRQLMTGSPSPAPSPVASPSPTAAAATRTPPPAQSSYPSPPNSGAGIKSPVVATTPEATNDAPVTIRQPASLPGLPAAPNANLGHDRAIRRKPTPASSQAAALSLHAPQPSYSSSIYSAATAVRPTTDDAQQETSPSEPRAAQDDAPKASEPWVQPPSRFSVTTYATSAADTPRQSTDQQRPPVPALPSPPQTDGVMNRKRPPVLGRSSPSQEPIVISMSSPYLSPEFAASNNSISPTPARSQLPSQKHLVPRASSPSMYSTTSRPESVWSTSKALPPPPTETSMVNDRVGYLNARLESLGNRRININQAIKQMTELMPTDSILASEAVLRKREAEKRKVEALKVELSEVQREEYEIGLKLHRAYKRMDRNAEYEPTTLWVRRVTG
ncbi:hypothetical protein Cob_v013194 [Colletotrichum orbiculare MAFF 240422]|uniref:Uncharacterized protein n=1 Tax=Colletotrichum orbiculare (strain 104-T / ATCC 96160 / CBS 514.97 / LARS 414 / MAFF 240422) TaxID=1213857 RepID=A0A484F7T1_COLOR|nr:hypothetical protein Cob_v013194 [Colletotrichum orbiculare MAFF 240422]